MWKKIFVDIKNEKSGDKGTIFLLWRIKKEKNVALQIKKIRERKKTTKSLKFSNLLQEKYFQYKNKNCKANTQKVHVI